MTEDMKLTFLTAYHRLWSQYHCYRFNRYKNLGFEAAAISEYHLKRYHYHTAKYEALERWYSFR